MRKIAAKIILISIYLTGLPVGGSALAQTAAQNQALLSRVYQAGDIDALESLASEKVQENPADPVAHFYMGLAYYKQKKYILSAQEFKEVLKRSNSTEGKLRARQYLDAIATESAQVSSVQFKPLMPSASSERALEERIRFLQEAAKEKKRIATEHFSLEIKDLKEKEKRDDKSQQEDATNEKLTKEAFERFSRTESEIDRELARQIETLKQSARNTTATTPGDTRILPGGSGIYLRNYEHLGDDSQAVNLPSENALSAEAKPLKEKKKK